MRRALAVCLVLAACDALPREPVGAARAPIMGGEPSTADRSIVLIAAYPPDLSTMQLCTATVVSARALLTSAHCVDGPSHPDYRLGVFLGADATAYPTASTLVPRLLPIEEVIVHPDYDPDPPFLADIAVVTLPADLDVSPVTVSAVPLGEEIVGAPARIVGYGQEHYGELSAMRRTADTTVKSIDLEGDTVVVGDVEAHTCIGDSGGPALVERNGREVLIGVDSYTELEGCLEPAFFRRTDTYVDFLRPFVARFDEAEPGGAGGGGNGGDGGSGGESTDGGAGGGADDADTGSGEDSGCSIRSPNARGAAPSTWLWFAAALLAIRASSGCRSSARSET